MIRLANEGDFEKILDMSENFWENTIYKAPFDREHTKISVKMSFDHGLLSVFEKDDNNVVGFIAIIKYPLLASASVLAATEMAWWVEPEHRNGRGAINLLLFSEQQAKLQGVKYLTMVSMESSNPIISERIYQRLKYSKSETSFTKEL